MEYLIPRIKHQCCQREEYMIIKIIANCVQVGILDHVMWLYMNVSIVERNDTNIRYGMRDLGINEG